MISVYLIEDAYSLRVSAAYTGRSCEVLSLMYTMHKNGAMSSTDIYIGSWHAACLSTLSLSET